MLFLLFQCFLITDNEFYIIVADVFVNQENMYILVFFPFSYVYYSDFSIYIYVVLKNKFKKKSKNKHKHLL